MFISNLLFYSQFEAFCLASGLVLALCWAYFRLQSTSYGSYGLSYPPGPPAKSRLFGNLSDIPKCKPWVSYTQWRQSYGDIVHFRVLRQHMIILNSLDVAKELLDKRSSIYSDRPHLTMIDIMDWDFNTGLRPYGPQWRNDRRVLHHELSQAAIYAYRPILTEKVNDMLYHLLTTPEDFKNHYRTVTAALIMRLMYGYNAAPKGDYFIELAEAAADKLSDYVYLGAATVNAIPILRFIPSWFPGAGFKKFANESKELTTAVRNATITFVKKSMASGTALPSIASRLFSTNEDHEFIKNIGATMYSGASDTTASALGTFFLAMALHPGVQTKAQEEIDTVVGSDRLPTLDDRASLHYIEALYREVLRWRPVGPLGVAHSTTADDTYRGYFIPKGSLVIPNVWAMTRDEDRYKDPELFNPERYLDEHGELINEDDTFIFGFGRRICPGQQLATSLVWLAIASVLSTLNIRKKKDASGKEIPIDGEYSEGMASHPLPFECSVTSRSEDTMRLITASANR